MQTFALSVDNFQWKFDTDGVVTDASNNTVGKWTTTPDNKIKVTKTAGGTVEVAVDWSFNASNQLTISSGGTVLVAFRNSMSGMPRLFVEKNVLVVDPDGDQDFKFQLQCSFGIKPDGNLLVAFKGGAANELDGYLSDTRSRFRFEFNDKESPGVPNAFVLSGEWIQDTKSTNAIRMQFKLSDAAQSIDGKPLALPAELKVEKHKNSLALVYEKNGLERRIQFLGSMQIGKGWRLEFKVDYESNGATKKVLVTVETTWDWDGAQGGAKLYVGKTKTANSQEITVGGSFTHKILKTGTTIGLDFTYTKGTAGGVTTTNIAASAEFEWKNAKLIVKYKKDTASATQSVEITGKLEKDDFVLNGGILIANQPEGKRVGIFLGITF